MMRTNTYDAVIIGGGMSGMIAAITLADKGRKVAVISKGDPVCCLSTGCIDLLSGNADPVEGIKSLPDNHPYHLIKAESINDSLEIFKNIMSEADLPYVGNAHENRKILTPLGTGKTTCLVPKTMEFAQYSPDEYVHLISFDNIKDFYPGYITSQHKKSGCSVFDAGVATTIGIAERFEDKGFLQEFISWLKSLDIPEGKIAIPAVLGIRSTTAIFNEISSELGRNIFEIPTLPPSMPGRRLFEKLKNTLLKKKGDLYWGSGASGVKKQKNLIESVALSNAGRAAHVQGRAFIMATGSFVSGGLFASTDTVKETAFDLPVYFPTGRENWFNDDFFVAGHAIEKSGIQVDSSFRPLGAEFENLFVCGSILAFSEIMKYRCGHGIALITGMAAANVCEEYI